MYDIQIICILRLYYHYEYYITNIIIVLSL